ncbi:uncharacterized protein PG986_004075 [Apiospora aurea]|uniref:Uncharacterized protein n=1 Tax=Apiospora aurea TaxID=335848 RepID=A0ABR1QLK2_9PEZI
MRRSLPPSRPRSPASQSLLPVPTQVQILAACLAALGAGWAALAALFVHRFRKHVGEKEMAQRIAHRLATAPTPKEAQPREFVDDMVLEELAIFNRLKRP